MSEADPSSGMPPRPSTIAPVASSPTGRTWVGLVLTVFACCPGFPLAGAIVAMCSIPQYQGAVRSMGRLIAFASVVIGLSVTTLQVMAGFWAWENMYQPVFYGPQMALQAGFAGDMEGFRAQFSHRVEVTEELSTDASGTETAAHPDELFIAALRERYGEFHSATLDRNASKLPADGSVDKLDAQYVVRFSLDTRTAKVRFMLETDEQAEALRIRQLVIPDKVRGDLLFPTEPSSGTTHD
ncbi:MAG: hypothetical protein EXS00_07260 [Phycisphaerales bacterium]|nr:hypothetical protein [Phycisphaerales bacterium]